MTQPYLRRPLPVALALCLSSTSPVLAQQVIADGDEQVPAAGDYHTVDPVQPGDPSGHAFYAINGGSIIPAGVVNLSTEGRNAHAAHAEGADSHIALTGGRITTSGVGAAGLSVASGASLHARDVVIETQGIGTAATRVDGGTMLLEDVTLLTHGPGALVLDGALKMRGGRISQQSLGYAVEVRGGSATLEEVTIDLGWLGQGLIADGASVLDVTGVSITGISNTAVTSTRGAQVSLRDSRIELVGGGLALVVNQGARLGADNVQVVLGEHGRLAEVHGAALSLQQVTSTGGVGIWAGDNARVDLQSVDLRTHSAVLEFQGVGAEMTVQDSHLESVTLSPVWMPRASQLTLRNSTAVSHADSVPALDMRAGQVNVHGSHLQTHGRNAHAVYASGGTGYRPVAELTGSTLLTEGDGALGAVARQGGTVHLVDSVVRTSGINAHGVLSGGAGEMTLSNTHVRTEGEGAWAAVINDNGRLQIDGGSLVSAEHGGVWLRSSRDAGLTLGNGALLSGGNGTALSLDAAVSGRFDVRLENGAQMQGDIVITREDLENGRVPQSQVQVSLAGGSHWWGSSDLVEHMELDGGSQWTLGGDARVAALTMRDSTLALSDGRSAVGNTLTVDGDLHSDGGTLLFHGALAGDDTVIDRLHVRGDTSGDASLRVQNIGGVGAPTEDGIPLIQVDGASLARYALAGRAVGGSYEYFLFQGGIADPNDGQWYLRSQWFDRCQDDPTSPGCVTDPDPTPGPDPEEGGDDGTPITPPGRVLRPEAGAYLANQAAAVGMFQHRLHDRSGAPGLAEGRGAWARVGRQQADFQAVGGQLAVDGTTSLLQVGSDVWQRGGATVGLTLGSGRADNTVVSTLTGYTAKGRVRGTAIGAYATWLQRPGHVEGAYLDASVQRGRFDNRVDGVDLPREQYDAHVLNTSVEGGYTFNVWQGPHAALYVQPQLQLSHVDYRVDRHVERNGTRIDNADSSGVSGRLGVRVFGHDMRAGNIVQPYMAVNWLRGMRASTLDFNGDTLGADVPRDRYEVQAGAELKLGQRWSAWGGMSVQRGAYDYRNVGGQLGMRVRW